jgi:6-phosphogluconate dehydrogenase
MKKNMQVAVFGLGRMGTQIAKRLKKNKYDVLGWNRSEQHSKEAKKFGVKTFQDAGGLIGKLKGEPRIFWLMLPYEVVHEFLFGPEGLNKYLHAGDIVIDGGNSFYKDSIKNALTLKAHGVHYFDVGVSGGIHGFDEGFALMAGGPKEQWPNVEPILKALSSGKNYGLVGESGAGHFVKMVHNGIEYGMMEAIAEGYAVLEASQFKLDLKQVTKIYQKGTVIRSWLIDLMRNIFEEEHLDIIKGEIAAGGEAEWTIQAAKDLGIDVRVIEDSLKVRQESRDIKNQNKFSNKIVALLRKQFGGHGVEKK